MIKAVVFDMDGVIADTEPLHEKARNALLESLGLDVEQLSPQAIGRSKRSFWSEISQKFNLKESGDELTLREFDIIMRIAKESHLKPSQGMKELLEFLEREKIKAAVASSSDRNYVEKILALTDLGGYFCVTAWRRRGAMCETRARRIFKSIEGMRRKRFGSARRRGLGHGRTSGGGGGNSLYRVRRGGR